MHHQVTQVDIYGTVHYGIFTPYQMLNKKLTFVLFIFSCEQEPFYGNPDDVPLRPTVFAGREFRIPSSADIPHFLTSLPFSPQQISESAPAGKSSRGRIPHIMTLRSMLGSHYPHLSMTNSVITATKLSMGTRRLRGLAFTPAAKPPSTTEISDWLTLNPKQRTRGSILHPAEGGEGDDLITSGRDDRNSAALLQLDPNTGALLLPSNATLLSEEPAQQSTPSASPPVDGLGSLLGTPDLVLASAVASLPELPSGSDPPGPDVLFATDIKAKGGPVDHRGNQADMIEDWYEVDGVPFMRPASPKYDQRSGFYQETASVPLVASTAVGCDRHFAKSSLGHHDTFIFRPGVVTAAPSQRTARLQEQLSLQQSLPTARRNLNSSFQTPVLATLGQKDIPAMPHSGAVTTISSREQLVFSRDNTVGAEGLSTSWRDPKQTAPGALDHNSQHQLPFTQQPDEQQLRQGTPQNLHADSGLSPPEPTTATTAAAAGGVTGTWSPGEPPVAPPSAFKGTATLRSQAQHLSLISQLKPLSRPSAATPPSQR
jgi:hypothetical protein